MPILAPAPPPSVLSAENPALKLKGPSGVAPEVGASHLLPTNIPVVSLDVDTISDAVAARLATSLLGHVLFLKSQVPLPVTQLSRMSNGKSTARALKQRSELLSSFDTLSSHLNTTFTALSSALSHTFKQVPDSIGACSTQSHNGRVYLAIFVGSNTASAKSKVIYAVDGLELKAIGVRDDAVKVEEEEDLEDDSGERKEEIQGKDSGSEDDDDEVSDEGDESEDDENSDENEDDEEGTDPTSSPPQSRSPSPEPPSHAEEQKALQAAERLLSRTLATADAEGSGMSVEMAPTQTHILLRAPRRFIHPAWVPRQNLSASVESALDEFLEDSGVCDAVAQPVKRKKGKSVEGVWVTPRGGFDATTGKDGAGARGVNNEWDEMIWWSWEGKIMGFSEW